MSSDFLLFFFFQAEDGIRALYVTGVQTCALPIFRRSRKLLCPYSTGPARTWWARLTSKAKSQTRFRKKCRRFSRPAPRSSGRFGAGEFGAPVRGGHLFGWPSNPHAILFTLEQFSGAPRQKMVWLWLPIELSAPGTRAISTRAINKADRRRTHGTDRNATRAPLGPPLLETRPRQRRGLHLSGPDPRSCGHRSDPFPDSQPQSRRHDGTEHRPRRPRHHRLLPPHARSQDRQDQQVRRAIPDFLGHLQRLRPPCELGGVSSPAPLRHGHARRHFQSQARRLLVGASSLALSNASRRQAALGSCTQHLHLQDLGLGRNPGYCFFHLCW